MGMPVNTPRAWRFGVFELDALKWRTAPQWHGRQAARTAGAHSSPAAGERRADGHARTTAPASLAVRHLRRFRPQSEFCGHEAPRGPGRLGRQASLHRNHPQEGLSLRRARFPPGRYSEWRRFVSIDCGTRAGCIDTREQSNGSIEVPSNTPDEKQSRRWLLSRKVAILIC